MKQPDAGVSQAQHAGLFTLLSDFQYGGNPGTVNLSGLTVGTVYEFRLYAARFGTTFFNRNQNVTCTNGSGVTSYDYIDNALPK